MNRLYDYFSTRGLEVNTENKIMVFRKRGGLLLNEHWTNYGQTIEVVNDLNSLGTVFSLYWQFFIKPGIFNEKALKARHLLLGLSCRLRCYVSYSMHL